MATFTEIYGHQGSDLEFSIDLDTDPDLTGYTAVGNLKRSMGYGATPVPFDLFINPTGAELTASLTAETTASMGDGRWYFTINIQSGDPTPKISRVLEGFLYLSKNL